MAHILLHYDVDSECLLVWGYSQPADRLSLLEYLGNMQRVDDVLLLDLLRTLLRKLVLFLILILFLLLRRALHHSRVNGDP